MNASQKIRIILAALVLICFSYAVTSAQSGSAQSAPAEAKTVTLSVTVRDKHDQVVRNLTRDDFMLEEDGRPQSIKYFLQPADMPLTVGVLVDTSPGLANVLGDQQRASRSFLDDMLVGTRDQAFLIHFDREVELLQDVTPSREKIEAAIELLRTASAVDDTSGSSGDPGQGTGRARGGRRRLLYDSLFLASDELTSKQQGRKVLIVLSDGVDRGSRTSLESALTAAQRSDTIIYSILFKDAQREERGGEEQRKGGGGGGGGRPGVGWPGRGWPGGGGGRSGGGRPGGGGGRGGQRPGDEIKVDGKKILERISKETGGRFFEVSKKEPVEKIFPAIAEELRAQYSLGYIPSREGSGMGYHHIKLEAKNKGLTVQTREGYYAERP